MMNKIIFIQSCIEDVGLNQDFNFIKRDDWAAGKKKGGNDEEGKLLDNFLPR